jgi:RHS repeat-associated protein
MLLPGPRRDSMTAVVRQATARQGSFGFACLRTLALLCAVGMASLLLFDVAPVSASPYGAAAWGENARGDIGDGFGGLVSPAVPEPTAVVAVTGTAQVAAGGQHSLALLSSGKIMAWGSNFDGELGTGEYKGPSLACVGKFDEQGCSLTPLEVPGISTATAVSAGFEDSFALLSNGTIMGWGEDTYGQVGNGTYCEAKPCATSPAEVKAFGTFTEVSAGAYHTLALKSNGGVEAWGRAVEGQLGDGNTTGPTLCQGTVPCSTLPVEVKNIGNAVAVSAGFWHGMALLKTGKVVTWGDNEEGELGNGNTTDADEPVEVKELNEVTAIAGGDLSSMALLKNGTVMTWGWDEYGQLGNGTVTTFSDVPVQVSGLSEVVAIAAGNGFDLALLKNGTLMAWGKNEEGQLGNGTFTQSDVPVAVSRLSGASGISAGDSHAMAFGANFQPAVMPAPSPEEQFGLENPGENQRRACSGDPVNCATGNLTESQTDLTLAGRGIPLTFTRTYNAQAAVVQSSPGSFGYGWSSSFSDRMEINPTAGTLTVVQSNGGTVTFQGTPGQPGEFAAPEWAKAKLSFANGEYTYTLPNQNTFHFDEQGHLLSESDRSGNTTKLSLNAEGRLESVTDAAGRKLTFTYNSEGELGSIEGPMGNTVKYTYEGGNLMSVTEPGATGPRWQSKYDLSHRLTTMIDGRGGETINEYDSSNRVIHQIDPAGRGMKWEYRSGGQTRITNIGRQTTTVIYFTAGNEPYQIRHGFETNSETTEGFTYDEAGDLASKTDGNGHITRYGYNSTGDRTSMIDADKHETKWTYNSTHDVLTMTTPNGEKTTYVRNSAGEPESISRPGPNETTQTTKYTYDSHGNVESMTDPMGRTWKYEYNNQGDRTTEIDPEGDKRTWQYNEDSQETATVSPRGNVTGGEPSKYTTKTERDAQDRPVTVTDPLGHATKYSYDGNGNLESVTDPNGHKTTYTYNADNQLTKVEEPNKTVTETGYDGAGEVISQTDGNKHTTKYVRNALEQVIEIIDPRERKTHKEYDSAGNVKKVTDAAGRTKTYVYDPANRLTEVTFSGGMHSFQYEYNADGERTKVIDGTGTTTYAYDQLDRLTESKDGHGNVTKYEYDLANEQTKITYPNGKSITHVYDKDGRLQKVTDWLEHATTFSYSPDSNLATVVFPTATKNEDKYAYNEADQMNEAKMTKGTETLASLVYARDNDGQVKSVTAKSLPGEEKPSYEYDPNNRLAKAGTTSYEYDAANDPTKIGASTYTYNSTNELETGTGFKYTYDTFGERTKTAPTSGVATIYGYNQAGRLISVERLKEAKTAEIKDTYSYGANELRASQTLSGKTTYMTWDTSKALPLLLDDGTNSYIYGPGGLPVEQINDSTGTVQYLHHDQAGSTRLVTGPTGTVEGAYTYTPYGAVEARTGTATAPLGYDGQYTSSDTGFIYLRSRVYDPTTAQFMSVDPLVESTRTPYTYAGDNPLNFGDPSGRAFQVCIGVTISVIFATVEGNVCYVNTPGGEGVTVSGGASRGPGFGANIHGGAGGSNAQTPEEYGGPFATAGGSVQAGVGGFAGGFLGHGACETVVAGGTAGGSVGVGAEGGVGASYTEVFPF